MESPVPSPHENRLRQVNGLQQGSVLAPTLFNLYTNDLPATLSRRFICADDLCCAFQVETFCEIECTLTADLAHLAIITILLTHYYFQIQLQV